MPIDITRLPWLTVGRWLFCHVVYPWLLLEERRRKIPMWSKPFLEELQRLVCVERDALTVLDERVPGLSPIMISECGGEAAAIHREIAALEVEHAQSTHATEKHSVT